MNRRDFNRLLGAGLAGAAFAPAAGLAGVKYKATKKLRVDYCYQYLGPNRPHRVFHASRDSGGDNLIFSGIYPASMSKAITCFPVYKAVMDGRLDPDADVTISSNILRRVQKERIARLTETNIWDALRLSMVYSANDAASALAEWSARYLLDRRSAGTEWHYRHHVLAPFLENEIHTSHTEIWTVNGLPGYYYERETGTRNHPHNVTCVADLAQLTDYILEYYPDFIKDICARPRITVNGRDYFNTNKLLQGSGRAYEGVDGLKTGTIDWSGSCMIATAKRAEDRIIVISAGHPNGWARDQRVKELFDHAFQTLENERKPPRPAEQIIY